MSATAWIVVALVVWAIAVDNRLVQLRNRIANAFAPIDVQLKRRYDLVPHLVEVARGYPAHEAAMLELVYNFGAEVREHRGLAWLFGSGTMLAGFAGRQAACPRPLCRGSASTWPMPVPCNGRAA
ncbi:LemA family protein [Acidovorax sp.]|uniref:LemA family protein n=1 Tax=Acidovorax sp. TaxID=1872122 RepID=UPI003BB084B3